MTVSCRAIKIVDAFTTRPFAGNPAAVVLDASGLDDAAMQRIAREMNLSETAFLLPPGPGADVRIRWFTPHVEVDLCGHGTVAAFHAALMEGRLPAGSYRMECRSGILPVTSGHDADGPFVEMGVPVPVLSPGVAPGAILEAIGLDRARVDPALPIRAAGPPGSRAEWALIPVADRAALDSLRPDSAALVRIADREGVGNVIALTRDTVDPSSAVHLRMFAPAYGIAEDPVTGSAQGPVAAYLVEREIVRGDASGAAVYTAEQGDGIGRAGRIGTTVEIRDGACAAIRIRGRAVTVLEGTITTP